MALRFALKGWDDKKRVALDWGGELCGTLGFVPGKLNICVFGLSLPLPLSPSHSTLCPYSRG